MKTIDSKAKSTTIHIASQHSKIIAVLVKIIVRSSRNLRETDNQGCFDEIVGDRWLSTQCVLIMGMGRYVLIRR
jgi:hypothetical protein